MSLRIFCLHPKMKNHPLNLLSSADSSNSHCATPTANQKWLNPLTSPKFKYDWNAGSHFKFQQNNFRISFFRFASLESTPGVGGFKFHALVVPIVEHVVDTQKKLIKILDGKKCFCVDWGEKSERNINPQKKFAWSERNSRWNRFFWP